MEHVHAGRGRWQQLAHDMYPSEEWRTAIRASWRIFSLERSWRWASQRRRAGSDRLCHDGTRARCIRAQTPSVHGKSRQRGAASTLRTWLCTRCTSAACSTHTSAGSCVTALAHLLHPIALSPLIDRLWHYLPPCATILHSQWTAADASRTSGIARRVAAGGGLARRGPTRRPPGGRLWKSNSSQR